MDYFSTELLRYTNSLFTSDDSSKKFQVSLTVINGQLHYKIFTDSPDERLRTLNKYKEKFNEIINKKANLLLPNYIKGSASITTGDEDYYVEGILELDDHQDIMFPYDVHITV